MSFKDLSETNIRVVREFALCDMSPTKTARNLFFHRNNVLYHLEQVKKKTGLDPFKFYDLVEIMYHLWLEEGEDDDF